METQKFKFMGASLLFTFVALMLVIACSPAKTWTVTVDPSGGTVASTSYTVDNGGTVDIPAPTKDGYFFNGWTTSNGGTTADFVPNSTAVTSDVTIYAIWLKGHTVTINTNGGTPATITKIVADGATLTLTGADIPTNSAKYVNGIKEYRDQKNDLFTMGTTPVKDDMNLRVRWSVDLNVVWNMLNPDASVPTSWIGNLFTAKEYIFTKTANANEIAFTNTTLNSSGKASLVENDRFDHDYIAKLDPYINGFTYVKSLTDTSITLCDVSPAGVEQGLQTYTKK